jgi:hypothetical protein
MASRHGDASVPAAMHHGAVSTSASIWTHYLTSLSCMIRLHRSAHPPSRDSATAACTMSQCTGMVVLHGC